MTLLEFLVARYPDAKRTTLRRMLDDGRITINGDRARSMKTVVNDGDDVRVSDRASREAAVAPKRKLPIPIVHEDDDVLVIDKPPGLLTSTVPREKRATALAMVREYFEGDPRVRVGLIHRLDRDASGLLIFSKNAQAYESLKQQFFDHTVDRIYHAIIDGTLKPAEGRIESHLIEHADGTVHTAKRTTRGAQHAITDYKVVSRAGGRSLVRIKLHTGRKHQIRAHLAERGRPIVNDPVYSAAPRTGRLMLVATELAFDHPQRRTRMHFEIPLPHEMAAIMKK